MAGVRIENFAGMIPRISRRLLPDGFGEAVINCKLTSGELRAFAEPRKLVEFPDFVGIIRAIYRVPNSPSDVWVPFEDEGVDVVPAPLVNDAFDRLYWTETGDAPRMTTKQRLIDEDPALLLGVPGPTTAPSLIVTGGAAPTETRAYVYTFVSDYGEEGPPSPPVLLSGNIDGSWDLSALETTVPDASERNITKKRIYRTVTGTTSVEYYFVAEITLATTTYSDTSLSSTVAQNNLLESTSFQPPPSTLSGLVVMPNGFLAGFSGRDIYFSEPYRPHAWPPEYVVSTEFDIVGLGVIGSTLVACTRGAPYVLHGVNPAAVALAKTDLPEPCVAKRSIISSEAGVLYASPNGLVLVTQSGARMITEDITERNQWLREYVPSAIRAVRYQQTSYLAFTEPKSGFIINPTQARAAFVKINDATGIDGVSYDRYTGDIYLIIDNRIYQFDPPSTSPLFYDWKSKEFDFPRPLNLGAAHVKLDTAPLVENNANVDAAQAFNDARMAFPLDTLNMYALNTVKVLTDPSIPPEIKQLKQPIGGSPLFLINEVSNPFVGATLEVYADGELVYAQSVEDSEIVRLPSGFKTSRWQFRLVGNAPCYSLAVSETRKELMNL